MKSQIKRINNEVLDDEEDFTVGTIAGLEPMDNEGKEIVRTIRHLNKANKNQNQPKGEDATMTTQIIEKPTMEVTQSAEVTPEMLEGTVALKLRKQYLPLVDVLIKTNDNVIVQDKETYFQLNAKQIKVSRTDGERALGRLNDGQWRMLFMNKQGEISSFTDNDFVLGIVEAEETETKELAQLNTRIDSRCKLDMDEIRDMLGMTQAKFLEVAINEYVAKVRAEMII